MLYGMLIGTRHSKCRQFKKKIYKISKWNSSSSSIYFAFIHGIHITIQIKQNLNKKTIAHYIDNITVLLKKYV